ncbi:DUF3093 domain-containing protein [Nocardioides marmoribigeumensis]|uniref:DUF3093 domain-containing protein n=1 Tax=Nocardioides marmoribigeumensis TaxID=433649 RepID=A0ABU2BTQ9_9ACTN|nr:DUF3093 domain-containing protein [Nocardioides marmoribigeumensis]MDR7361153.1 hypothetical protein [Nocardioides marmoribigeumensis]
MTTSPSYAEVLRVPLRWWAVATMFHASALLAFLVAGLGVWAYVLGGSMLAFNVGVFLSYGGAIVEVRQGVLYAGRAHIPLSLLADPQALDGDEVRLALGVDADARAYLVVRPYIRRGVIVRVDDPADPTPYWLVSSRHPRTLAAALAAGTAGTTGAVVSGPGDRGD